MPHSIGCLAWTVVSFAVQKNFSLMNFTLLIVLINISAIVTLYRKSVPDAMSANLSPVPMSVSLPLLSLLSDSVALSWDPLYICKIYFFKAFVRKQIFQEGSKYTEKEPWRNVNWLASPEQLLRKVATRLLCALSVYLTCLNKCSWHVI